MRKLIAVFLAIAVAVCVVGCASSDDDDAPPTTYHVTVYAGNEVVREWNGVEHMIVSSQYDYTRVILDGKTHDIKGGLVICEEE